MREFTTGNFDDEVMQSTEPVLVDFWAPWCGPCRAIAPIIEELSGTYEGRVKIGKLNTDDHPEIASKFGITSIPTLLLFKNGEIVGKQIGVAGKAQLEQALDGVLA